MGFPSAARTAVSCIRKERCRDRGTYTIGTKNDKRYSSVVFFVYRKKMWYYKNDNIVVFIEKEMDVMPKVKNEYLENKRNQILDAAFAVCKRKPAYDITMTDIVSETGMSQGGVYKYFNNIDLVLAALIDKANLQGNYMEQIDEIMESDNASDVILHNLFLVSEQYFSDMLISYNKIFYL